MKTPFCIAAAVAALLVPTVSLANSAATPTLPQEAAVTQQATPSAAEVLANIETVSPVNLIYVVSEYWNAGNKLQAAFWYYVWQIRTEPWAQTDPEFARARLALNQNFGSTINSWIFADPELVVAISERAMSFEPRLPLWNRMPEGMSAEQWEQLVQATRVAYANDMRGAFAQTPPDQIRALRQQNGLPVGTLTDIGLPLPEDWR
ncbi:hypothetical protein [uncultured Brevundimonas sp.]|uniref:hypothetical protein n=1 Tax=uncultured Brevundimonas sp. TaxID=213418 RepID=UPI0026197EF1|nr:hypothetical protein [uncultured Brevundimonas sp.]